MRRIAGSIFGGEKGSTEGSAPEVEPAPTQEAPAEARDPVVRALRQFVVDQSDGALSLDAVDPGAPLFEDGLLDSFSGVALLEFIEANFGVEIEEVELLGGLHSIDAIAGYVARQREPGGR